MPGILNSPDYTTTTKIDGLEVLSASGAITQKRGAAVITKAGVAALTLALPTSGDDDGKELVFFSSGAYAHTITTPAAGVNGASTTLTFGGAVGDGCRLVAYHGSWYLIASRNVSAS